MGITFYPYYLTIKVKFVLSSTSNGLLFCSVNHTLISRNFELNVFKEIRFGGEISSKLPNGLFGTNVYNIREFC